jgi:ATP-dependent DNA helicase PIF1
MQMRVLKESHRQSGDREFVKLLDRVRVGEWDEGMRGLLEGSVGRELSRGTATISSSVGAGGRQGEHAITATKLCSHRRDVDEHNMNSLSLLPGRQVTYEAIDSIGGLRAPKTSFGMETLQAAYGPEFSSMAAEEVLHLKRGAQVILVKNLDVKGGFVNGAKGVVIGFVKRQDACTRVERILPVVRFYHYHHHHDGDGDDQETFSEGVLGYHNFETEISEDLKLTRCQIPLKLAWGLTIHRSQGMTLDSVEIDLRNVFADGQAYVALSRAKSLKGVSLVENLNRENVRASRVVKRFYERLESLERSGWVPGSQGQGR